MTLNSRPRTLTRNRSTIKSRLTLLLKIAVAAGLVTWLVRSGQLDPKDLWALMTPLNVAVAVTLIGINLVIAAWRWIVLLRSRGLNISLVAGFRLYLIGVFFNHALPGAVGGDVVRGYYVVAEYPGHRLDAVLSVLIDRILGLYSFFVLTLLAVAWDFEFVRAHDEIFGIALGVLALFLGQTLFFAVVFSKRLSRACGLGFFEKRLALVHKVVSGFQRFGQDRAVIAKSVVLSLLAQVTVMSFFYLLAGPLNEPGVSWPAVLFAVPMGFLVTAVPIAPAGIGVGQWAFLYLFKSYLGHDTQFGATAVTAFQLTLLAWGLVGAVVYLRRGGPRYDPAGENTDPTHDQVR